MRVPAENEGCVAAARSLLDTIHRRGAQLSVHQVFEVAIEVIVWRRVAHEDIVRGSQHRRQLRHPGAVRFAERVERMAVGGAHALEVPGEHLALVIAANGGQLERHQAVGRFGRQQRAGENVPEIHGDIDAAAPHVLEHRVEREQVAVDVRQRGDFHDGAGPYLAAIFSTIRPTITKVRSWVPAPISSAPSVAQIRKSMRRPSTPQDLGMACDFAPDGSRHQMPYVDARADGALARFQILPDGVQRRIFHDQHQIRRREHGRQDAVLEAAGKMVWLDAQSVRPARADRYLLHGVKFTGPCTTTARFLGKRVAFWLAFTALTSEFVADIRMRQVLKSLGLLLLLLVAQQGAVVHEVGHLAEISSNEAQVNAGLADATCALCPAFAQVVTPAFSHSFHIPVLLRATLDRGADPLYVAVDAAVPTPRSRGPPSQA